MAVAGSATHSASDMHWIFTGIAMGVGIMLAPTVIGVVIDILIAPIVLPIVMIEAIVKRLRGH